MRSVTHLLPELEEGSSDLLYRHLLGVGSPHPRDRKPVPYNFLQITLLLSVNTRRTYCEIVFHRVKTKYTPSVRFVVDSPPDMNYNVIGYLSNYIKGREKYGLPETVTRLKERILHGRQREVQEHEHYRQIPSDDHLHSSAHWLLLLKTVLLAHLVLFQVYGHSC